MAERRDTPIAGVPRRWVLVSGVVVAATLVLLAIAIALILRNAPGGVATPTTTIPQLVPPAQATNAATPPLTGVFVAEVVRNDDRYIGRTITLRGEVDTVIGERAFTVGDGDFVSDDRLLVLSAAPLPQVEGRPTDRPLLEDDLVRVTGQVQPFDRATAERELGVNLDDPRFLDWLGRPSIIAQRLRLVPREQTAGVAGLLVSTADLTASPDQFVGSTLTTVGVVTRIVSPESFVLNDQVLVTYFAGLVLDQPPTTGQLVLVTGRFGQFDLTSLEQEIGRDLPEATFAPFDNWPAIVAATIRPEE